MSIEQEIPFANGNAGSICFGLDRPTDERSLCLFLQRYATDELLASLVPRLTDQELSGVVDLLAGLLRTHLNDKEYHTLFLRE
jgi:hypothetical protein